MISRFLIYELEIFICDENEVKYEGNQAKSETIKLKTRQSS